MPQMKKELQTKTKESGKRNFDSEEEFYNLCAESNDILQNVKHLNGLGWNYSKSSYFTLH